MSDRAKELFDEAMKLPREERALLGAELLGSVHDDSPEEVETAWRTEIMRRIGEAQRGDAETDEWSDVYARLRARLHSG